MIKPIASELLKACLIENHIPLTGRPGAAGHSVAVSVPDSAATVEIRDIPDEFASETGDGEHEASAEEIAGFRKQVDDFFAPDGPLRLAPQYGGRAYEYRCQQGEMALAVADALIARQNLAVEAPTGVGKSFAYLVPMILFSRLTRRPAVVSTETISLQEQLVHKDLPLLEKLLGVRFNAALAKGRSNYLCRRRLALAAGEHREEYLPHPSLAGDVDRIYRWSETSEAGNRDEADFYIGADSWNYVCCEAGNCAYPKCRFRRDCFYRKAREAWAKADVIVANHALFFTDLKMQMETGEHDGGLLPAYGSVVIDEAHSLEANAAEHLGLYLTCGGFNAFLNRLYNPDSSRGLLLKKGATVLELRAQVTALKSAGKHFFAQFEDYLAQADDSIRAVTKPGLFPNTLQTPLMDFRNRLGDYTQEQEDIDFKSELEAQLARCDAYIDGIAAFLEMTLPESVYWVERDSRQLILQAAPLNVAEILRQELFGRDFPIIATSATLTVDKRFNYFNERTGFTGGPTKRLDSPFEPDHVTLYLDRAMPDPAQPEYEQELFNALRRYLDITDGKAFVLFTSYALLRRAADSLEDYFLTRRIRLLTQGGELSRSAMLREFKTDIRSVIFGTDSFWTGVDVPGEALSNVIITKLPFSVPSHPLIQARCDRIKALGGNPFFDYSLPEAVLKFRQGAGRLIRSRDDRGIIVVLDSRVVTKRYGRMFVNSLPEYPQQSL